MVKGPPEILKLQILKELPLGSGTGGVWDGLWSSIWYYLYLLLFISDIIFKAKNPPKQ